MNIVRCALGSLPLEDVKARSGREDEVCLDEVHLGDTLVALTDKFRMNMLIVCFKGRIVRTCRQIVDVLAALFELIQNGLKDIPVSLAFREDADWETVAFGILASSAEEEEFELDDEGMTGKDKHACNSDDDREEHASRAGIYILSFI
jgi:hypothetical protein